MSKVFESSYEMLPYNESSPIAQMDRLHVRSDDGDTVGAIVGLVGDDVVGSNVGPVGNGVGSSVGYVVGDAVPAVCRHHRKTRVISSDQCGILQVPLSNMDNESANYKEQNIINIKNLTADGYGVNPKIVRWRSLSIGENASDKRLISVKYIVIYTLQIQSV